MAGMDRSAKIGWTVTCIVTMLCVGGIYAYEGWKSLSPYECSVFGIVTCLLFSDAAWRGQKWYSKDMTIWLLVILLLLLN